MDRMKPVYQKSDITSTPYTIFQILGDPASTNPYVIDLENSPVFLGEGSILLFCGGILKDGEVYGDNTTIQEASFGVLDNVKLSGTYTNSECDLSWWGCIPYDPDISQNIPDNAPKIKRAVSNCP